MANVLNIQGNTGQDMQPPVENPEKYFQGYQGAGMHGSGSSPIPGIEGGSVLGGLAGLMQYFSPQARDDRRMQDQMHAGLNEFLRQGAAPAQAAIGGYNDQLRQQYPRQTQLSQNPLVQNYVRENEGQNLALQGKEDLQNYAQNAGVPAELAPEYLRGQNTQAEENLRFGNEGQLQQGRFANEQALQQGQHQFASQEEQERLKNAQQLEQMRESGENTRQQNLLSAENQRDESNTARTDMRDRTNIQRLALQDYMKSADFANLPDEQRQKVLADSISGDPQNITQDLQGFQQQQELRKEREGELNSAMQENMQAQSPDPLVQGIQNHFGLDPQRAAQMADYVRQRFDPNTLSYAAAQMNNTGGLQGAENAMSAVPRGIASLIDRASGRVAQEPSKNPQGDMLKQIQVKMQAGQPLTPEEEQLLARYRK